MEAIARPDLMRRMLEVFDDLGYMGDREMEAVSAGLRIPSSRVYGFRSQFEELPGRPSRARVTVCAGSACAGAGAWEILESLRRELPGEIEVRAGMGEAR